MTKKKLFDDLKEVIEAVVKDATPHFVDGVPTPDVLIRKDLLYNLQSEYNIHFVEPDEKQLDCITK